MGQQQLQFHSTAQAKGLPIHLFVSTRTHTTCITTNTELQFFFLCNWMNLMYSLYKDSFCMFYIFIFVYYKYIVLLSIMSEGIKRAAEKTWATLTGAKSLWWDETEDVQQDLLGPIKQWLGVEDAFCGHPHSQR